MPILKRFLVTLVSVVALALGAATISAAQNGTGETIGKLFDQLLGAVDENGNVKAGSQNNGIDRRVPFGREQIQLSFAPLVKATSPSVVNVYAARHVQGRAVLSGDPFFDQFFGEQFRGPPRMQSSLGSGVIVDASGIIVTNNHVIADADEVRIALSDGREFECTILLKDDRVDLAILKVNTREKLPVLQLANSDELEVGDLVLAMGNPFGVGQTTTSGIISALARNQVGVSDFGFFIQTDAAINPGNSGGALINMSGQLIGVNTAIFSKSGGSVGIGFAIPSNMVRTVVEAAKAGGDHVAQPYLGATFEPVTSDVADSLGMDRPIGALVNAVVRGGPADKGGLKVGDVVLSMDGFPVEHPDALGYRLLTSGVGKTARLEVLSRGMKRLISVKLEAAPADAPTDELTIEGKSPLAGAVLANLTPRLADKLRIPSDTKGVVITEVYRNSPANRSGMRPGDIILEVNGTPLENARQAAELVSKPAALWRIKINRGGAIIRQFFR